MKNKNAIFGLLMVLGTHVLFAQSTIQGRVTGTKGESIPGVNINIKGTYDGTSSDKEGGFQFNTEETGEQTLVFQFIGYQLLEMKVVLLGTTLEVKPTLKEGINQLTAVTISAGAMEASDEKKDRKSTRLNSSHVRISYAVFCLKKKN